MQTKEKRKALKQIAQNLIENSPKTFSIIQDDLSIILRITWDKATGFQAEMDVTQVGSYSPPTRYQPGEWEFQTAEFSFQGFKVANLIGWSQESSPINIFKGKV